MSHSESLLSPDVELSLDDCDALLKFVKEEVKDPDLPELGTSANLILNANNCNIFFQISIFLPNFSAFFILFCIGVVLRAKSLGRLGWG